MNSHLCGSNLSFNWWSGHWNPFTPFDRLFKKPMTPSFLDLIPKNSDIFCFCRLFWPPLPAAKERQLSGLRCDPTGSVRGEGDWQRRAAKGSEHGAHLATWQREVQLEHLVFLLLWGCGDAFFWISDFVFVYVANRTYGGAWRHCFSINPRYGGSTTGTGFL